MDVQKFRNRLHLTNIPHVILKPSEEVLKAFDQEFLITEPTLVLQVWPGNIKTITVKDIEEKTVKEALLWIQQL